MEKEKEIIFIDTETICEEELRLGDAYEQTKSVLDQIVKECQMQEMALAQ